MKGPIYNPIIISIIHGIKFKLLLSDGLEDINFLLSDGEVSVVRMPSTLINSIWNATLIRKPGSICLVMYEEFSVFQ